MTKRNIIAAGLHSGQFQPRRVRPAKGKGSFRRRPKHKGRGE